MGRYVGTNIIQTMFHSLPYFPFEWTDILVDQTGRKMSQNSKHQNWYKKVIDLHVWVF